MLRKKAERGEGGGGRREEAGRYLFNQKGIMNQSMLALELKKVIVLHLKEKTLQCRGMYQ